MRVSRILDQGAGMNWKESFLSMEVGDVIEVPFADLDKTGERISVNSHSASAQFRGTQNPEFKIKTTTSKEDRVVRIKRIS